MTHTVKAPISTEDFLATALRRYEEAVNDLFADELPDGITDLAEAVREHLRSAPTDPADIPGFEGTTAALDALTIRSGQSACARSTYTDYKALPVGTVVADISGYWHDIKRHHVKTTDNTWAVFFHLPTQAEVDEAVSDKRNNVSPAPLGHPSYLVGARAADGQVA